MWSKERRSGLAICELHGAGHQHHAIQAHQALRVPHALRGPSFFQLLGGFFFTFETGYSSYSAKSLKKLALQTYGETADAAGLFKSSQSSLFCFFLFKLD